jgi:uncharacterized protein YbaA (DUF1428 family)
MSASRGGILIGVAVVVGILIFSVINRGGPSASTPVTVTQSPVTVLTTPATNLDGSPAATTPGTTVTTKAKKTSSKTAARSNDQVVVQVLNGSGVQGAATQRSNDLKAKAYQVLPAGNAPSTRDGTAVQCKAGYEKEADALVATLNELGVPSTVEAIANPLPAGNAPSTRDGTAVQCKAGYEKEADALVATLNELGVPSTVEAIANPLPAGFDASANCYVLLGK